MLVILSVIKNSGKRMFGFMTIPMNFFINSFLMIQILAHTLIANVNIIFIIIWLRSAVNTNEPGFTTGMLISWTLITSITDKVPVFLCIIF